MIPMKQITYRNMNSKVMNRLITHGRGLLSAALIGLAMLILPVASHAAIGLLDGSSAQLTRTNGATFGTNNFTVSAGADVLVFIVAGHSSAAMTMPSLSWGAQSLTLATSSTASSSFTEVAIYYLYNPTAGTHTISGTVTGGTVDNTFFQVYTLNGGVDTTVAPLTGLANLNGQGPIGNNVSGIIANSWAAVAIGNGGTNATTLTVSPSGTVNTIDNYAANAVDNGRFILMGYVSGLAAGTSGFTNNSTLNNKLTLAEVVFELPSAAVITTSPAPVSTWRGLRAVFTASVGGSRPITYLWKTNGVALADGTSPDGSVISGSATNTLTIANVSTNEAGSYFLTATNSFDGAISTAGVLTVLPFFTATNFTMTQNQGSGDWNSTGLWSDPYGGKSATDLAYGYTNSSFEVLPGAQLRSPNLPTNYIAFPGVKLTVDGNGVFVNNPTTSSAVGQLKFKETFSPTTNYYQLLVMAGGQLDNGGVGTNALGKTASTIDIQGTVNIVSNTPIYVDSGGGTNRAFQIDAFLKGNGGIDYRDFPSADALSGGLNITGATNTYTGTWNVVQGPLVGSGNNSLGTNQITVGAGGILETAYAINNSNAALVVNGRVFLTQNDTLDRKSV